MSWLHKRNSVALGAGGSIAMRGTPPSSASAYTGPLDIVPGAVVAYGVRALSAAWLGQNLFRLRNQDDDSEQTFSADAVSGNADWAAIATFAGIDNPPKVITWFDQSGNGRNVTQATPGSQPTMTLDAYGDFGKVDSGVLRCSSVYSLTGGAYTLASFASGFELLLSDDDSTYVQCRTTAGLDLSVEAYQAATGNTAGFQTTSDIESASVLDAAWQFGNRSAKVNNVLQTVGSVFDAGAAVGTLSMTIVGVPLGGFEIIFWLGIKSGGDRLSVRENQSSAYELTLNLTSPAASPDPSNAGALLAVTTGTWNAGSSPVYTYQWNVGGGDVEGATSSTYQTVTPDEAGLDAYCKVTNTNSWGVLTVNSNVITLGTP